MAVYQTGNVTKIFEFLALSPFRITPRLDLSAQCVLWRLNPNENPVCVCRNGPAREIFTEVLRTQSNTDFGAASKTDGPRKTFRSKSGFLEKPCSKVN